MSLNSQFYIKIINAIVKWFLYCAVHARWPCTVLLAVFYGRDRPALHPERPTGRGGPPRHRLQGGLPQGIQLWVRQYWGSLCLPTLSFFNFFLSLSLSLSRCVCLSPSFAYTLQNWQRHFELIFSFYTCTQMYTLKILRNCYPNGVSLDLSMFEMVPAILTTTYIIYTGESVLHMYNWPWQCIINI